MDPRSDLTPSMQKRMAELGGPLPADAMASEVARAAALGLQLALGAVRAPATSAPVLSLAEGRRVFRGEASATIAHKRLVANGPALEIQRARLEAARAAGS